MHDARDERREASGSERTASCLLQVTRRMLSMLSKKPGVQGGGPFLIFGSAALHTARVQTSSTPDVRSQNRVRRVFQQAVRAACPGEAAFPRASGARVLFRRSRSGRIVIPQSQGRGVPSRPRLVLRSAAAKASQGCRGWPTPQQLV